jgi:uncharacterized membrane protein YjdF
MYPKSTSTWRYPAALLAAYAAIWLALAIDPVFRSDWLLENAIVIIAVPLLVATAKRWRFSDFAYTCLFAFFVAHAVGAHYTYSLVPYAESWHALGGAPLEGRNHYDRVVHALYGLLVAPAAVELFGRFGRYSRPWDFLFPWMFMAGAFRRVRARRVCGRARLRRRPRPGIPRHAGRHLGRPEGHGARARGHDGHARGPRVCRQAADEDTKGTVTFS